MLTAGAIMVPVACSAENSSSLATEDLNNPPSSQTPTAFTEKNLVVLVDTDPVACSSKAFATEVTNDTTVENSPEKELLLYVFQKELLFCHSRARVAP